MVTCDDSGSVVYDIFSFSNLSIRECVVAAARAPPGCSSRECGGEADDGGVAVGATSDVQWLSVAGWAKVNYDGATTVPSGEGERKG